MQGRPRTFIVQIEGNFKDEVGIDEIKAAIVFDLWMLRPWTTPFRVDVKEVIHESGSKQT